MACGKRGCSPGPPVGSPRCSRPESSQDCCSRFAPPPRLRIRWSRRCTHWRPRPPPCWPARPAATMEPMTTLRADW